MPSIERILSRLSNAKGKMFKEMGSRKELKNTIMSHNNEQIPGWYRGPELTSLRPTISRKRQPKLVRHFSQAGQLWPIAPRPDASRSELEWLDASSIRIKVR